MTKQQNKGINNLQGMVRTLTGQNTQQLIYQKRLERKKERLSTTNLSASEIAVCFREVKK